MRPPSKKTVCRLRMELESLIMDKIKGLQDTGTLIYLDEAMRARMNAYGIALRDYLRGHGIPIDYPYSEPYSRRGKHFTVCGMQWYIYNYGLVMRRAEPFIWVCLSSEMTVQVQDEPPVTNISTLNDLVSHLTTTMERLEGERLCGACYYSVDVNNKLCCGMGMMPAPLCTGYIGRQA